MSKVEREFTRSSICKTFCGYCFAVLFIIIVPSSLLFGQWKCVHRFGALYDDYASFWSNHSVNFVKFNPWGIGFAGVVPGPIQPKGGIWKSTDSGQTWHQANVPDSVFPEDVAFKDSLDGWFTSLKQFEKSGEIYATTDGGEDWFKIFTYMGGTPRAICYSNLRKTLFVSIWILGEGDILLKSTDEGYQWFTLSLSGIGLNGFAQEDSVIIAGGIGSAGGPYYRSSDGGLTWASYQISNGWPQTAECWQPCIDSTRSLSYQLEDPTDGIYERFFRSTNNGLSWQPEAWFSFYQAGSWDPPGGATGCCAVDGVGNVYIQHAASGEGMYRSSDSGSTWMSICGPDNRLDTRFCVFNNTIFAGGYMGDSEGIWELRLSSPYGILLDSEVTLIGTRCEEVSRVIHFTSTFPCPSAVSLDSISLQGSGGFTIDSGAAQFDITQGNYSVNVHYQSPDSLDTAKLIFHYTENGIKSDTSVTIYGISEPDTSPSIFSVQELGDTTISPGDSVGVTFVPGAGTLVATDSVELTLRYDPNAVSLSSLAVPPGWWVADSSFSNGVLTLVLRSDSAESLPNPLLHAEFKTYLTPSSGMKAFIYLDNAQSFFPQTTPCAPTTLSLASPDSVEIDFTGCGDSTILAAMEHAPPFSIESIVPNPAQTDVRVSGTGSGVSAELVDALGRVVISAALYPLPFTLDVSQLPSGIYFLRFSRNGYVQSRSVSIQH